MILPMAILDSKWDNSTSPPTELVLVQWMGFAPEDTTWEDWNGLRTTYHLEDKVLFPGSSDDSNSDPQEDSNTTIRSNEKSDPNMKQDFVGCQNI
ncbi:Chromo-like domain superfamily [Sesbania bispinosa]|nr:Chromo-like domain superfamily [Sesbania bispinosa]